MLCCCSVTQSCPPLCNPMDCSTPGFPVCHHLLEFAQIHVHVCYTSLQTSPCCLTWKALIGNGKIKLKVLKVYLEKCKCCFLKRVLYSIMAMGTWYHLRKNCPVPGGRGSGQDHGHRVWEVFVIPKCLHNSKTYPNVGQEFPSLLGLSPLAFWFSLAEYQPQGNQVKPLTQ